MDFMTGLGVFLFGFSVGSALVSYILYRKYNESSALSDDILLDAWCIAKKEREYPEKREEAIAEAHRWWDALTIAEKTTEETE